jgi:hypothetical protein
MLEDVELNSFATTTFVYAYVTTEKKDKRRGLLR